MTSDEESVIMTAEQLINIENPEQDAAVTAATIHTQKQHYIAQHSTARHASHVLT